MKNINVQTMKSSEENFFKLWLMILQPFLKLRKQEVEVLSKMLYYRYVISKDVSNKVIVEELLFNSKTKKTMIKELKIADYTFNNILSSLRKKKIILNNSINNKIVPIVEKDFKSFKLIYNIEII